MGAFAADATPPAADAAFVTAADAAPPFPGERVLDRLGDPRFLTAAGSSLYWIDADTHTLHAWREEDGGAPRVVADSVASLESLVAPFTVTGDVVHLLTQIDGERSPRVERVATSGGARKVLSNAIPDVIGVAFGGGHVLVALDVAPPTRSMLGEVAEVGLDRRLQLIGKTNGQPRAMTWSDGALHVASAVGVTAHRPGAKDSTPETRAVFCAPAIAAGGDKVYFARSDRPSIGWRTTAGGEREVALPAFPVALAASGTSVWVGTRDGELPSADGGIMENVAGNLREADRSIRARALIREVLRVDVESGTFTRVATFDPPVTSYALTDRAIYVASPVAGGAIHRLPHARGGACPNCTTH